MRVFSPCAIGRKRIGTRHAVCCFCSPNQISRGRSAVHLVFPPFRYQHVELRMSHACLFHWSQILPASRYKSLALSSSTMAINLSCLLCSYLSSLHSRQ
ncbi:hypothetical protein BU25DRAFT_19224 [Macroventuria anomochaeta]|uniref:Uncharacterized protein n=1 Tax=Macroventuria anomochaeta TaxID=301207 RepID=A0ACB6S4V5_9PLEO|nr:uncharacterized protein BU25DRAFT_19224 [Macroventuria anomochaeta]KAF2629285.1 hypothetical protein BU25DRAFT_19224 [Macroventuria anomochaeta]